MTEPPTIAKFRVGERVTWTSEESDGKPVPGEIRRCLGKFLRSPEHRCFSYSVWFDEKFLPFENSGGIHELVIEEDHLALAAEPEKGLREHLTEALIRDEGWLEDAVPVANIVGDVLKHLPAHRPEVLELLNESTQGD